MDLLRAMRVFVAVAEEEGFAPAARRLGMSPPAVTRAVAGLEEHLGARLFNRTSRVVRLTTAGSRYLADCHRILGELREAERAASGAHAEPAGPLTVTAPSMFGRLFVTPVLLDFLARYPRITARAMLVDRVVDLIDEGVDVAVRIAALPDSSLSAIRVGSMRPVLCAAPAYLDANGTPETPDDLAGMDGIGVSSGPAPHPWTFQVAGRSRTVQARQRLSVNSPEAAVEAAAAGHGLARLLAYQVEPHVRAGALRLVLEEFEPPPIPVHVVHVEGRRAAARIRAFVDMAVERLRAETWLG